MAWEHIPKGREYREWLDDKTPFVIQKKPDDGIALRISVGGKNDQTIGVYVVYRGQEGEILQCLENAVEAFKKYIDATNKGDIPWPYDKKT